MNILKIERIVKIREIISLLKIKYFYNLSLRGFTIAIVMNIISQYNIKKKETQFYLFLFNFPASK